MKCGKKNLTTENVFFGKFKNSFNNNYPVFIIISISLILHFLVLNQLGVNYTIKSDDLSYINSGKVFAQTGEITMHGPISAQIMPGLTFLVAFFYLIFGESQAFMISLKLFWMFMGHATIFTVYKTANMFLNKYLSLIPTVFFLSLDYVWMNNLILTETPYLLFFSLLVYLTFRLGEDLRLKNYVYLTICYIVAVFFRPNIGIAPIFIFIYLLSKKHRFLTLLKGGLIAGIVLIMCLLPWTIRNYKIFGDFIPLTYGVGNPKLLGTYQGYGYPTDEELDYSNLDENISDEMRYYLQNKDEKPHLTRYYSLEYDDLKAEYRKEHWWNKNKKSMLVSYFYIKPKILLTSTFYWDEVLGVPLSFIHKFIEVELYISILALIVILIRKHKLKETMYLLAVYGSQILIYSLTFAFGRYGITMFFLRYLILAIGLSAIFPRSTVGEEKN
ncbi:MAG: ArnT family glycosyltransferase [Saccharofermentanales bacterium]|jgi:hypothetical protein